MTTVIDVFGHSRELHRTMCDADLASVDPIKKQNAYLYVATALGQCRLHGITPDAECDGVLPVEAAVLAATAFERHLQWFIGRIRETATEEPDDELEEMLEGCSLYSQRMDDWAASVAIIEAWEIAIDNEKNGHLKLDRLVMQCVELEAMVDELLESHPLMSSLKGSQYVKNVQAFVAAEYLNPPPWWLDEEFVNTSI